MNQNNRFELTPERSFEFTRGQHHYGNGGSLEDLTHPWARAGWQAEKYWRDRNRSKNENRRV